MRAELDARTTVTLAGITAMAVGAGAAAAHFFPGVGLPVGLLVAGACLWYLGVWGPPTPEERLPAEDGG